MKSKWPRETARLWVVQEFSREFKLAAVNLVNERGVSIAKAIRDSISTPLDESSNMR